MPVVFKSQEIIDNLRPRIPKDVYQTPIELAIDTVGLIGEIYFNSHSPTVILDAGAGNGVWGDAARTTFGGKLVGVDIRRVSQPDYYNQWYPRTNYLTWTPDLEFDLIIGNPPFNLSEKFILHSRELLSEKGVLCFLLPSQFQHGQKRTRGLFRSYQPEYIVSLAQRPNFTGPKNESLGTANTDDYVLMIWTKDSESNLVTRHLWLDWKAE